MKQLYHLNTMLLFSNSEGTWGVFFFFFMLCFFFSIPLSFPSLSGNPNGLFPFLFHNASKWDDYMIPKQKRL